MSGDARGGLQEDRSPLPTGLLVPPLTPFLPDGAVDPVRFVAHAEALLDAGVDGLCPFGTTGEGTSLSAAEKEALLDALLASGVPADRLIPGIGGPALPEVVRLAVAAVDRGCAGVLLLPPYFYKGVSADGLRGFVDALVARVDRPALRIVLYHFPAVAGVGWPLDLVAELRAAHPGLVLGMKDSECDPARLDEALVRLPGFRLYAGNESEALRVLDGGGAGVITAMANVAPGPLRALVDGRDAPGPARAALRAAALRPRARLGDRPLVPALKALLAAERDDPGWRAVRPPLQALRAGEAAELVARWETGRRAAPRA